jgi:hypothetical protein
VTPPAELHDQDQRGAGHGHPRRWCAREIKDKEGRVSVQPDGVVELVYAGHQVVVQAGAGSGCGFTDAQFAAAGAKVVGTADEVFAAADLIVKVKEPIPEEYHRFRPGQQLFTFLHLAADRRLTEFLLERRIDAIAYETAQTPDGKLPLLTPMSEVAGRMSIQAAARCLESAAGRRACWSAACRARPPRREPSRTRAAAGGCPHIGGRADDRGCGRVFAPLPGRWCPTPQPGHDQR